MGTLPTSASAGATQAPAHERNRSHPSCGTPAPSHLFMKYIVFHPRGWPGDLLMLTAAVRDLHLAYPGRFHTDVDTSCRQIWDNNPYLSQVDRTEAHHYLNMGNPPYSHSEPNPDHLATRYHKRIFELLRIS